MEIRIEGLDNPIGIDEKKPRFSYTIVPDGNAVRQVRYRISVVANSGDQFWDSGNIDSDQMVNVEYVGKPLLPFTRYTVNIRAEDDRGNVHQGNAFFETGRLDTPFEGEFITADFKTAVDLYAQNGQDWDTVDVDNLDVIHGDIRKRLDEKGKDDFRHPLVFEKTFQLDQQIREARLYASSMGIYFCEINGKRVGEDYFAPGWTSHTHQLQYYTYDVAGYLKTGENTIRITVANGWYNRRIEWVVPKYQQNFTNDIAAIACMDIQFVDGGNQKVCTDESWTFGLSNIELGDFYDGEHCDGSMEVIADRPVRIADYDKSVLTGICSPPVKVRERLPVRRILHTPKGETVLDVGVNVVGVPLIRISGHKGEKVSLRFGEILDHDGNFYNENYRSAKSEFLYTLREGYQEYVPQTTYYGFRYIKVCEFPGEVKAENFEIQVLYSALEPAGAFECSNADINQLHKNIMRTMKGNYVDIPTDCPQRDERLGWTGDAYMFLRSACYLYQVDPFYQKWLKDMAADQGEKGAIPNVVPFINIWNDYDKRVAKLKKQGKTEFSETDFIGIDSVDWSNFWGDAAVLIPDILYDYYGDQRILQRQLPCMEKWCDFLYDQFLKLGEINPDVQMGDWVGLDAKEGSYIGGTPVEFTSLACTIYSFKRALRAVTVLNDEALIEKYRERSQILQQAFEDKFCTSEGIIKESTQTAKIMAIKFDLVRNKQLQADRLAAQIRENDCKVTVGFIGIAYILEVLSDYGYLDLAYNLLLRTEYPSWLYQIKKGATTLWEHLDGIKEDGSLWTTDMNSFNHTAYGSIGNWLYSRIGGIRPDPSEPGFKHFFIQPEPGEHLTYADMTYESMYGVIHCRWSRKEEIFKLSVRVPFNTTADIILPGGKTYHVNCGYYEFEENYQRGGRR